MYSDRFVQRFVLLACAAFLLSLNSAGAKEVSKDKIVRALKGGNAELRAKVLDYLDEQADGRSFDLFYNQEHHQAAVHDG